jgi:hypothetical protein
MKNIFIDIGIIENTNPQSVKDCYIIQFLRDNGFIEFVQLRKLQEGENIVGKIVPTPIGRFYLEQREKFEKAGDG